MTDPRKPAPCHFDRTLGERVTRKHRDDCPGELDTGPCPAAGRGCAPCTAPHCLICGQEHATNSEPNTCAECVGKIRDDLTDIQACYTDLAREALDAGADGHLVAAAPIPGGTAQVLIGPTVRLNMLRTGRGLTLAVLADDHRPGDPIPPLAILAQWEDIYRIWLDHKIDRRVTVAGALGYLGSQLAYIANHVTPDAPDFVVFTKQLRSLRAHLERALHDEREPERGVECFACGDRLVRRFRDPKRCRHSTPAREWFRVLASYGVWPYPTEAAAARLPCDTCSQGGLDDPRFGRSWECPGCRKEYTPGEYATATRRDLLENGDQGDGWTHVTLAAEAATDLVGMTISESTVRKWLERGKVSGLCAWTPGRAWGQRLVYWPDVAAEAVDAVARLQAAEERRRQRAVVEAKWRAAVARGEKPRVAAKRLGIDKGWLNRLLDTVAA